MNIDKIICNDDVCYICVSPCRCLLRVIGNSILGGIALIGLWYLIIKNPTAIMMTFAVVATVVVIPLLIISDVQNFSQPPSPIILSYEGVKLPNGNFAKWNEIVDIFFERGRGTPIFRISTKQNALWCCMYDWYIYTNKKNMLFLFKKYSQKTIHMHKSVF